MILEKIADPRQPARVDQVSLVNLVKQHVAAKAGGGGVAEPASPGLETSLWSCPARCAADAGGGGVVVRALAERSIGAAGPPGAAAQLILPGAGRRPSLVCAVWMLYRPDHAPHAGVSTGPERIPDRALPARIRPRHRGPMSAATPRLREKGYLTLDHPAATPTCSTASCFPVLVMAIGGIGLPGGAVYINTHLLRRRLLTVRLRFARAGPLGDPRLGCWGGPDGP